MIYRRAWRWLFAAVAGTLVGLAILEWGAIGALGAVLVVALLAAAVLSLLPRGPRGAAAVAQASWWVGVGLVGWYALLAARPSMACLLALLAGVTSPAFRRIAPGRRRAAPKGRREAPVTGGTRPRDPAGTLSVPELVTDNVVQGLGDDYLCRLWRSSYWELTEPHTCEEMLRTVVLRQRYLDELERRNPAALEKWLASGARASGGPEKFWAGPI